MSWHGFWFGNWQGDWHGEGESDPGAMYAALTGTGEAAALLVGVGELEAALTGLGAIGATLAPAEEAEFDALVAAGHWKHLFQPLRHGVAAFRCLKGVGRVDFLRPVGRRVSVSAEARLFSVEARGFVVLPATRGYAKAEPPVVRGQGRAVNGRARGAATIWLARTGGTGALARCHVSGSAQVGVVECVGAGRAEGLSPSGVQNPTEEMLLALL